MRRAAIYARVSTVRQAEHDLSLPDQIAQCRSWCERHGVEVVEVYTEPGASALDEDRPVFQEMIFAARKADHPFDLRSEEHTSELQSLMRISYAVFCLKKKKTEKQRTNNKHNKVTRQNQ